MRRQSKRTSAPAPVDQRVQASRSQAVPPPGTQLVRPQGAPVVPPLGFPSMVGGGSWFSQHPMQSMAGSSAPCWLPGVQLPGMPSSSTQGPWWAPSSGVQASASPRPVAENIDDADVQAWDPHPPGGFVNFLNGTQNPMKLASNGNTSQRIDVSDDGIGSDWERTEKRLPWTKEEDLRLVSAWLNNSNDPINSNYKKNDPVNGNEYNTGYYLADGIYPEWAAFMKTIPLPQTDQHKLFAKFQEGARKYVERAFGVLQSRFTIVRRPARLWKRKSVGRIMLACVILHNMIVEDEREEATIHIDLNQNPGASLALPPEVNVGDNLCFADVLRRKAAIRARPQDAQLKNDLVEHIWHRFASTHHN